MPIDPRIQAFLGQAGLLTQPGSTPRKPEILLAEQRAAAEKAKPMAALASELEPVAHVENLVIAGPAGDLPVRLYTPEGTGPFPVLLFFQKSWCAGNLDTHAPIQHQQPSINVSNSPGWLVLATSMPSYSTSSRPSTFPTIRSISARGIRISRPTCTT